ncbi:inositol monophosphatase [Enterococcus sp. JM4C]|uniref:inositol monophosphatase family protein n=1 Tax=Candidatus Enterococcus huntleyi TaxID=1857217 RepID=UPI00137A401D|nr:inositol monophosphatase family protein [Enterococcus sp. JM4C]KAF1297661.1 inositol monophosphatase [Enterococcus sp. JM4C]
MDQQIQEIKQWLYQAGDKIKSSLSAELSIDEKSSRTDLVTNMDREIQNFLIDKVHQNYPEAKILAEENGYNELTSMSGEVFVIDPIDGTLNFVLEKENFCIMVGLYEEGRSKLGFIYNVMQDELYWGGRGYGVFCNEKQLERPEDKALTEGLIGMNAHMYLHNHYQAQAIGKRSMGVRMSGCAGIELIAVIKGARVAYLTNLSPWDYAAGCAILDAFDFRYSRIDGQSLSFNGREHFVAGTPKAYSQMIGML